MISSAFHRVGLFCATHPYDVAVAVLACAISIPYLAFFGDSSASKICGWNFLCSQDEVGPGWVFTVGLFRITLNHVRQDIQSSDIILMSITRILAAGYVYAQFRKLDSLGSKYVLGLVGLLSVFLSVSFSAGLVHLMGYEVAGLADSLPYFLLLLDLTKVTSLARYSLLSASQDVPIKETVARGVAVLGPTMTLDTLVKVLITAVGCLSNIRIMEVICCFGCVSLIAHYVIFMTFFPGALCVIIEMDASRQSSLSLRAKKVDVDVRINPAAQRIKLMMSAGLALVHVYTRLMQEKPSMSEADGLLAYEKDRCLVPAVPLWRFYLADLANVTPQQLIGYAVCLVLCLKYVFFDTVKRVARVPTPSTSGSSTSTPEKRAVQMGTGELSAPVSHSPSPTHRTRRFTVGEESEEDLTVVVNPKLETQDKEVQTEKERINAVSSSGVVRPSTLLSVPAVEGSSRMGTSGIQILTDGEILTLVKNKELAAYNLEKELKDLGRAVSIRRDLISSNLPDKNALALLPFVHYDYAPVQGNCCENVIGYMPVPVGVAGPLLLDGKLYQIPLATTEGVLVASTNRGCRAVSVSGGAITEVYKDGMTRAPVVKFPDIRRMAAAKRWIEGEGFGQMKEAFDNSSRFARLVEISSIVSGDTLHLRFRSTTGDAMGMNMVSNGTELALRILKARFPEMETISLSGNTCTDKKPAAINWVLGRGKSVVCQAVISGAAMETVLKSSARAVVKLNLEKNLIGSAMAGSIGGYNAHAANIVAAMFLATGQDIAQTVVSSNCMTSMELCGEREEDLKVTCTMPCLEVGTTGGGTNLPPQSACLKMLGVQGPSQSQAGSNSEKLARIICGAVLVGELSLLSALAAGDLVKSHLKHNRSKLDVSKGTPVNSPVHRGVPMAPHIEEVFSPGLTPPCIIGCGKRD